MQPSEYYSLLLTGQKYEDGYFLVDRVILKKKKALFFALRQAAGFALVQTREQTRGDVG